MILITGGTGAIGNRLVEGFLRENQEIRILALPQEKINLAVDKNKIDIRYGDISRKESISGICDGISTVYHLAAVILAESPELYETINVKGTENILKEALKSRVKHFIYISSISVIYPKPTIYSLSKRKAEELVRRSGLSYTIIRPSLVYADKLQGEIGLYLDYLKKFPVVPFIGNGSAIKRPVYVEDIIKGLLKLNNNGVTYNKIYTFSGAEPISMLELSYLCLKLMKMKKMIIPLPLWFWIISAKLMKIFMKHPYLTWQMIAGITQSANLDSKEAAADLGYKPGSVRKQLPLCFEAYGEYDKILRI